MNKWLAYFFLLSLLFPAPIFAERPNVVLIISEEVVDRKKDPILVYENEAEWA